MILSRILVILWTLIWIKFQKNEFHLFSLITCGFDDRSIETVLWKLSIWSFIWFLKKEIKQIYFISIANNQFSCNHWNTNWTRCVCSTQCPRLWPIPTKDKYFDTSRKILSQRNAHVQYESTSILFFRSYDQCNFFLIGQKSRSKD